MLVVERAANSSPASAWVVLTQLGAWNRLLPNVEAVDRRGAPGPTHALRTGEEGTVLRFRISSSGLTVALARLLLAGKTRGHLEHQSAAFAQLATQDVR